MQIDHAKIDGHRYSVPENLMDLLLEAHIIVHAVELLHWGQRVTSHQRSTNEGGFITDASHLGVDAR